MKIQSQILQLLLFALLLSLLDGKLRCHKNCNGHGYCTDYDNFCVCDEGYTGVDCSMRKIFSPFSAVLPTNTLFLTSFFDVTITLIRRHLSVWFCIRGQGLRCWFGAFSCRVLESGTVQSQIGTLLLFQWLIILDNSLLFTFVGVISYTLWLAIVGEMRMFYWICRHCLRAQ